MVGIKISNTHPTHPAILSAIIRTQYDKRTKGRMRKESSRRSQWIGC